MKKIINKHQFKLFRNHLEQTINKDTISLLLFTSSIKLKKLLFLLLKLKEFINFFFTFIFVNFKYKIS